MTKTELWAEVQELLKEHKVTNKLSQALEDLIAPKSGGGSINPPKLDKDGNIVEAWCRFHEQYEPVKDLVMSQGKPKGYCKASYSKWNKTNAQIKKLNNEVVELIATDVKQAEAKAKEVAELKAKLNSPSFYNYDEDHKAFNAKSEPVAK